MATWDEAASTATSGSSSTYLKLADGEAYEVVVSDEIHIERVIWDAEQGRSVDFDPEIHAGQRPRQQYRIPVIARGSAKQPWTAQVYTASSAAFMRFSEAISEQGTGAVYVLRRKGTGLTTEYSVTFRRKLEGDEAAALAKIEHLPADPAAILPVPAAGEWDDEEEVPF